MKRLMKIIVCFISAVIAVSAVMPTFCSAADDAAVQAVIEQLEAIDTLQQMQDKRSEYQVSANYDANDPDIVAEHETARSGYESYVSLMFAARLAAQEAYDALSAEQQATIDPSLTAKLSTELNTVFRYNTYPVTPRGDEYTYQIISPGYLSYEMSPHMTVSHDFPALLILVDSAETGDSWTPDGPYSYGESNYLLTYCCDQTVAPKNGNYYKRVNLEDSDYYEKTSAEHIRAIVQSSYPFLSLEEMKAGLRAGGLKSDVVDELSRGEIIAAVQMAIWGYANIDHDAVANFVSYGGTLDVTNNHLIPVMHDYSNESWDWWWTPQNYRHFTYDARAAYRVNHLVYYLCNLEGVAPSDREIVISNVEITRADLVAGSDDTYNLGMYVRLNNAGGENDRLKVTVTSTDAEGNVTGKVSQTVYDSAVYELTVRAKFGDTVTAVVEGVQDLGKGVYFYSPEGGREMSQALVGVAEGETRVRAEKSFVFHEDIEKGIRIHKTALDTGLPISDIVFDIYRVEPGEGETVGDIPTEEDIARYAVAENLVGSVTTDVTGYGAFSLEDGLYMVVEQHNAGKVEAPADPFFLRVPMPTAVTDGNGEPVYDENGNITVEYLDVVSVYPKNVPVVPPPESLEIPFIPGSVNGQFMIEKYDIDDESVLLSGAEFQVYRTATAEDTDTEIIRAGGIEYAAVPVLTDGEPLILTTGDDGTATSPLLSCGPYFLVEKKAPKGYGLLEEAVAVTVVSNAVTDVSTVPVGNLRGHLLPETGGPGTAGYTAAGIVLIAAAVLFAVKKYAGKNKSE